MATYLRDDLYAYEMYLQNTLCISTYKPNKPSKLNIPHSRSRDMTRKQKWVFINPSGDRWEYKTLAQAKKDYVSDYPLRFRSAGSYDTKEGGQVFKEVEN